MITGAQTGVPAVALSGPNAMLSRKSFEPQVLKEDLDSKTFNIIPSTSIEEFSAHCSGESLSNLSDPVLIFAHTTDRDIVPMIDDRAQNFQEIRCNTATPDVICCHTALRSLCEIIYTCGSGDRPTFCECVTKFGYPEPRPKQGVNRTFAEACPNLEG